MSLNTSAYDEYHYWKGWDKPEGFGVLTNESKQYFDLELRRSERYLPTIENVLEIGFGNGQFLAFAKAKKWNIIGSELNPKLIEFANECGFKALLPTQISKISQHTLDLIVAFDVLEHIPQDEIIPTLLELKSKLREGGVFLIRFPNADHWLGNVHQNGDPTHVTAIGRMKLEYFCKRAGLKIISYKPMARRNFSSGLIIGLHSLLSAPILWVYHWIQKILFFPGLDVILSSTDCVAIITTDNQRNIIK
jgi:SAM-dependent methyltransferase